MGKTVLLERYSAEAAAAKWVVAEREFSEPDAEPRIFARRVFADLRHLARQLSFSQRAKRAAGELVGHVTDFLSGLTLEYEGIGFGYDRGRAGAHRAEHLLDDDLEAALRQIGALCAKSEHPGVVLRYDEFHVIRERKGWLTLSALLKAVALVQRDTIPVMLVLCGLPAIQENLTNAKTYSERMFTVEEIGHLRMTEARKALVEPARALGRVYDDTALDAVLSDSQGYPYFLQLYGDALWGGAEQPSRISIDDFRRLRPAIRDDLDRSFFEPRYSRASPREREIFHAIAVDGEVATIADVRTRLGLKNTELQPRLASLTTKGLIYRPQRGRGGTLAFTAPTFGGFIRRRDRQIVEDLRSGRSV